MGYKDEGEYLGQSASLKGSTVGFSWDIGYDFTLSKNWSGGIQLSLLSGILTEIKQTQNGITQTVKLEKEQYEGLGRMNISIGLRCNL